jgi:hypothetical protein
MRLVTVLALLLLVGICTAPAMADKDDPVKNEGDPRLPVDYDYYQINLTAGVQVIIETMASPVCDPDVGDTKLYLYGPGSCTTQVGYNDDISYPSNNYSRITYTPTATGVFYIKAQGYSSSYEGCYKMTIACAGVVPTILVDEVEPNDTCGAAVQMLTCDNYVHGRIGVAVALGACCDPCGNCTVTTEAACVPPSYWQPEWPSCSPNPCSAMPPLAGDTCFTADLLPCGTDLVIQGSLYCMMGDYDPTSAGCTLYPEAGADVAYMMILNAGDVVSAAITGYSVTFDSAIYLVTDCTDIVGTCVAGADTYPNPPGEAITYTVPPTGAGTYYLIIDKFGAGGTVDGFTLTYSITCPQQTAACCAFDGSCTVTTQAACVAPSVWHPEWPTCAVASCPLPPPTGACCFADGYCEVMTEEQCIAAPGHTIWMIGMDCYPDNPCPPPVPTENATWGKIKANYR